MPPRSRVRPLTLRYALAFICLVAAFDALADETLPYTSRTRGFSGFGSTVRGDMQTIGMAGAMVGLAHSYIGSLHNPAGLAMTAENSGFQISRNTVYDYSLQEFGQAISSTNAVAIARMYPWTLSGGYHSPHAEEASYRLPGQPEPVSLGVYTREFRLSVARVFLDNRLALGVGAVLGQARRTVNDADAESLAPGAAIGVMGRLPNRVLLGMSFEVPMKYDAAGSPPALGLAGFNQPVYRPWRFAIGAGWIPNRFFRLGAGIYAFGPTPSAGLVRNEDVTAGRSVTLQPRLGFSYQLADFKELQIHLAGGLYYETSRIADSPDRFHQTTAIEVNPWIFTLGTGIDAAPGYQNFLVSVGVDVGKIMAKLDLIPQPWHPPRAGWLPMPGRLNDEGLPRPLVRKWRRRGPRKDIIEVGKELPGKLKNRIEDTGKSIQEIGESVIDGVESIPGNWRERVRKAREEQRKKRQER